MRAIVIGGGIGGSSAAIALERCGISAEVFERAPELREVGAGISLWANALTALEVLGVSRTALGRGMSSSNGLIRATDGKVLTTSSFKELERRYGAAVLAVHRADLVAALTGRLREGSLHLGTECVGFTQDASQVTARFADGSAATADVLIGADGLRSVVRAQLLGDSPPRYAGYTAWRSVVHADGMTVAASESWGRGKRFGIVPIGDGRVYWFAVHTTPEGGHDATGPKSALMRLFKNWHAPIEALIDASDDAAIIRADIFDRDPIASWSTGRVTLLGDAAHPMTPNLGQGACQAIEDAVELAACLVDSTVVSVSLRRYEQRRVKRTSDVVIQSRRVGMLGQWENPILCSMRNAVFRAVPTGATERQLGWLVGYRGLSAAERGYFNNTH